MRLLGALGFDLKIFLIQAVNFLLLFLLLNRLFFKPFIKVLREEKAKALAWQNFSQKLTKEKERWQKEKRQQKLNAIKQIEEILAQAEQTAKNLQKNIYEQANQEAAEIIKKAKQQAKIYQTNWQQEVEPFLRRQILVETKNQLSLILAQFNLTEINNIFFQQLLAELSAVTWPFTKAKQVPATQAKVNRLIIPKPKIKTAEAKLAQKQLKVKTQNTLPAILEFSHFFNPEQEKKLSQQLKKKFKRPIHFKAQKNFKLIAGYYLQAEGIVLEVSLNKELSDKINQKPAA